MPYVQLYMYGILSITKGKKTFETRSRFQFETENSNALKFFCSHDFFL